MLMYKSLLLETYLVKIMVQKIFTVFFLICSIKLSYLLAADNEEKEHLFSKFKIGFEFQETTHLCPWAAEDPNIQNKSLFVFYDKETNNELWHLVIDTNDIEFVTSPFFSNGLQDTIHSQESLLSHCMERINDSVTILSDLFKKENENLVSKEKELKSEQEESLEIKKNLEGKISCCEKELDDIRKKILADDREIELLNENIDLLNRLNLILMHENEKEDLLQNLESKKMELKSAVMSRQAQVARSRKKETEQHTYVRDLDICKEGITKIESDLDKSMKMTASVPFETWYEKLRSSHLRTLQGCIIKKAEDNFELVKNKSITLPKIYRHEEFWKPEFSPQVTVQHPLRIAIPLYFYLFGFSEYKENNINYPEIFAKSMPHLDLLIKKENEHPETSKDNDKKGACTPESGEAKDENKVSEIEAAKSIIYSDLNGLMFLHALTLIGISDSIIDIEDDSINDEKSLVRSLQDYDKYKQIDAKMYTSLMSRRSFSDMFKFLKPEQDFDFYDDYKKKIINGNKLFTKSNIQKTFYKVNYGEQFFDKLANPLDLTFLCTFLIDAFVNKNQGTLLRLLKKGIVTTAMIRNLNDKCTITPKQEPSPIQTRELLNNYFEESISTIQSPQIRYEITTQTFPSCQTDGGTLSLRNESILCFQVTEHKHDAFSPPWFLKTTDSMGRMSTKEDLVDSNFGGAIIEIRQISELSSYFFENYEQYTQESFDLKTDKPIIGEFLKNPEAVAKQTLWLFKFLKNFEAKLESDPSGKFWTEIVDKLRENSYNNK